MDFWIELSTYYTELSLVWKLIACGTGLLAAGAAAYILKQRETETVFGRPAKGRIAAVGLLVMYMMLVLFPYGCLLPAALGWTSGRKSLEALSEN